MIVVILIDVAPGLRGHLTRWMVELRPGVFVGTPSKRIRDRFWDTLCERIGTGSAIMVEPSDNEQGWLARTAGTDRWQPIDFDGLQLMSRPRPGASTI